MGTSSYSLEGEWTETNRHIAAEDCAALLSNASGHDIRWARTLDSLPPPFAPASAHILRPGGTQEIPLTDGEILWMAGSPNGNSVVDVYSDKDDTGGATAMPATRSELATMAATEPRPDGQEVRIGGLGFIWQEGASAIPDLPGLVPDDVVTLEHFGASGDGSSDDTPAWNAANDYLESIGGGIIQGRRNATYAIAESTIASNVTFRGAGRRSTTLKVHPNTTYGVTWLENRDINKTTAPRTAFNIALRNLTIDGTELPYNRWLSQADGTLITDPEADYVMGSGALGSGISGVSLTAVLTGDEVTSVTVNSGGTGFGGHPTYPYGRMEALTITGDGSGAKAHGVMDATGALTSVVVTDGGSGYTTISLVPKTVDGATLTGSLTGGALTSVSVDVAGTGGDVENTVQIHFSGGGGHGAYAVGTFDETGSLVSVAMRSGGGGYTSAPAAFPSGGYADIRLLATPAVDRRNGDFNGVGQGVNFAKVVDPLIEDVEFVGFKCSTFTDGGCLNGVYRRIKFTDCTKDDGPYGCIVVQSRGNPENQTASYSPSENTLVEDIYIESAERVGVMFAPAKGGTMRRVHAKDCGEACVTLSTDVNFDGSTVLVEDCDLRYPKMTDIAGDVLECDSRNVTFRRCRFEGGVTGAMRITGARNTLIEDCEYHNCGTALADGAVGLQYTKPYGPYSERYQYATGSRGVCGDQMFERDFSCLRTGTVSGHGADGLTIRGCRFFEDRTFHPAFLFKQARTGDTFQTADVTIENNDVRNIPATMGFWDVENANQVFETKIPLHIRHNLGHASEGPVILSHQWTTTGTHHFDVGFRPRVVEIFADTFANARSRFSYGRLIWKRESPFYDRMTHSVSIDSSGGNQRARLSDAYLAQIEEPDGTDDEFILEFDSWSELGFTLDATTCTVTTNIRVVCHP